MITRRQIDEFSTRIVQRFHPEKVVLFGSCVYGRQTEDSDVDQAVEMRMETHLSFPLDLIVRTPAAVSERLRLGEPFISGILSTGRVLYEASHA
jgi:predicted nucleotidyltransferase